MFKEKCSTEWPEANPALCLAGLLLSASLAFGQTYAIQTLAGSYPLNNGGPAANAYLYSPTLMAADGQGNFFVVDESRIRRFRIGGNISTFAGPQHPGEATRPLALIDSTFITGLAVDSAGNVYYSDFNACVVRRITATGEVSIVAGILNNCATGADGLATASAINRPYGLAFDRQDRLLFVDYFGRRLRRVGNDGRVATVAGTGALGYTGDGGPALAATFSFPESVAIDRAGDVLVADTANCAVRRITQSTGLISTVARGSASANSCFPGIRNVLADPVTNDLYITDGLNPSVWFAAASGSSIISLITSSHGFADAPNLRSAQVTRPIGMAFDPEMNLYFVDSDNQRVRRVRRGSGAVESVVGTPTFRGDGGPASNATVFAPQQMGADSAGNLYFNDYGHRRVRRIDTRGQIATVAGSESWVSFTSGEAPALSTGFSRPLGLAVDVAGNFYVSDIGHQTLSRISAAGSRTLIARNEVFQQLALDTTGRRLFAVVASSRIVAFDPTTGNRTPVGGNGSTNGFPTQGSDPIASPLSPRAIAVHPDGSLFLSDIGGRIYRITNPGGASASIRQLAQGAGTVSALVVHPSGNYLFAADAGRVFRVQVDTGEVTEVAGARGLYGFAGDGGPALLGRFAPFSTGLALGPNGEIYVSDNGNHRIRSLTPLRAASLAVSAGNNQSGAINTTLANPLRVVARDASNAPLAGVEITFAVVSGAATLGARTAITGLDGVASATVQLGATPGPVVITASAAPLPPVTFDLTITPAPPPGTAPRIGAVAALGGFGGDPRMVAAGWFEIFGSNFAPASTSRVWASADFVGGVAPTSLADVRVTVAGRSAFVYFVSPLQITIVAPDGLPAGVDAPIQVINAQGSSNVVTLPTVPRAPGLLAPPVYKVNDRQYVVALFANFNLSGPGELIPGTRRARAGDALQVYFVNGGPLAPPLGSGRIAETLHSLPNVRLRIGTTEVPVPFAGLAPGFVGLYQFNFVVPPGVSGDQPLEFTVDGVPIRQMLYLAIE